MIENLKQEAIDLFGLLKTWVMRWLSVTRFQFISKKRVPLQRIFGFFDNDL